MQYAGLKLNARTEFTMHAILEVVRNGAYSPESTAAEITAQVRNRVQIYIECFLTYRCRIFHKPLEE